MKTYQTFLATTFIAVAVIVPMSVSALTIDELRAQIAILTQQIQQILAQQKSTPVSSTDACPKLSQTLSYGKKDSHGSNEISQMQRFLAERYGISKNDLVSGFFGKKTLAYVLRFQDEQNLSVDGYVGKDTRASITALCGIVSPTTTEGNSNTYTYKNIFSLTYPAGKRPVPLTEETVPIMNDPHVVVYFDPGVLNIDGLSRFFVEKLGKTYLTRQNPLVTYDSVSTGAQYWYDPMTSLFHGEKILSTEYDDSGKPLPRSFPAIHLKDSSGQCSLNHMVGKNTYTVIRTTDEGQPVEYEYISILSDGRALVFVSKIGIFEDNAKLGNYAPSTTSIEQLKSVLASVTYLGVQPVQTSCE